MQGPDFIYFIQDEDTQNFYQWVAGNFLLSAAPVPLEFSPDGWRETSISNVRNKKYFGIDRIVTIPYKFVKDGAAILKNIFYTFGSEKKVNLVIFEQQLFYDGIQYGYWYKQLMKADVDLSTFVHDQFKVVCTLTEGGLPKYLKANENTTWEFPLNDVNAVIVKADGVLLRNTLNYNLPPYEESSGNFIGANTNYFAGAYFISQEGNSSNMVIQTQNIQGFNANSNTQLDSPNYMLRNVGISSVSLRIFGIIRFKVIYSAGSGDSGYNLHIYFQHMVDNIIEIYNADPPVDEGGIIEIPFDINVTLAAGEKLFLFTWYENFGGLGAGLIVEYQDQNNFKIEFKTRNPPTYVKAFRPLYLFYLLMQKVCEGKFEVDSALLTAHSNKVFTSGDGVRGFLDAIIKISLSDFWSFWNCYQDVGLMIRNGKVVLELKKDLIDYTDIIDLGEVADFNLSMAADILFNTLKIGFPDKQQEGINGREEYLVPFEFSIGTTRTPRELDKNSKIIAGCYPMELTRIDFEGKSTTDSRQDGDNFVIHIENELQPADGIIPAHYRIDRSLNAFVSGLLEPETVFNLEFMISRCIKNNFPYFASVFDLLGSRSLNYQSCTKNNKVILTGAPDGTFIDKSNYLISSMSPGYFRPYYASFRTKGVRDLLDLLDTNPLKVFRFTIDGISYVFLPEAVGIEPSTRKEQKYKLLCGAATDLTPLIDYNG